MNAGRRRHRREPRSFTARRVDRIVELTPVEITVFGGGWSTFIDHRNAARARAEADLDRATDTLRNAERAIQKAREKKARRDKAGRAWRAKGIEDKMFMDREKERAENSAARESHLGGARDRRPR